MSKAGDRGHLPADMRKSAPLLAVLLFLGAGWLVWSGVRQWRETQATDRTEQARDAAVTATQQALQAQLAAMKRHLAEPAVAQALRQGDADAAAAALKQAWKGAEDVRVEGADLAQAFTDPAAFGYGRLGLLEQAQRDGVAVARVVRDGGSARLGVAEAVGLAERPAVAYARLPLSALTAAVTTADLPGGAYLALRQGNYNVVERGDSALAQGGETLSRPVGKTGLRIAMAMADVAPGPLGLGMVACLVAAIVLALAGIALLLVLSGRLALRLPRRGSGATPASEGPTLAEALSHPEEDAAAPVAEGADAGAAPAAAAPRPGKAPGVAEGIFRAYDIRGKVGSELTPATARLIGQAVGSLAHERGLAAIVVGRDGRLSGPELMSAAIQGLREAGVRVVDLGMVPSPVAYFAAEHLGVGNALVVTGSHNPPEYNGFKVVVGGAALAGDAIADLYARIRDGRLHVAEAPGGYEQQDVAEDYIQRIADDVQLDRPLKVVVDAGNGAAGEIAPRLLEAIGADPIPLYCDVDGTFPNHHPDPSDPANLADLAQTVRQFGADLGVAFDGDGDRLGVVDGEGRFIFPDRVLMLFAGDVLQRNPGALVIYDVKCTGKLADHVLRNGGSPLMWKTGHSLIKAKMRETDAELAGEMSGHFFFKERWYGFDDGLYAAARLLEILAQDEASPTEVLAALPALVATPEIKVEVADAGTAAGIVAAFEVATRAEDSPFAQARLSTIDGLRADFADGWGLLRASNTTPALVLRFEADDEAALERIRGLFRALLGQVAPQLAIGF